MHQEEASVSFPRFVVALATVAALVTLSGCGDYSQLSFVKDNRLTFTSPDNRQLITAPLRVSWNMRDFHVVPAAPAKAKPTGKPTAKPSGKHTTTGTHSQPAAPTKGTPESQATGVPATDDAGWFAVFVDRAPIKSGHTLADVVGDPGCLTDPTCPDAKTLANFGVYVTHRTSVTVPLIPRLSTHERVQLHEVTVVLIDTDGRRIGEAAWYRQFKMETPA